MAEKREKSMDVLLWRERKTAARVELFRASAWGGPADLFRLRVNGRWHGPGGAYHSLAEVGQLLAVQLGQALDVASSEPTRPDLPRGAWVRLRGAAIAADVLSTRILEEPMRGPDGVWMVKVVGGGWIPADAVELIKP